MLKSVTSCVMSGTRTDRESGTLPVQPQTSGIGWNVKGSEILVSRLLLVYQRKPLLGVRLSSTHDSSISLEGWTLDSETMRRTTSMTSKRRGAFVLDLNWDHINKYYLTNDWCSLDHGDKAVTWPRPSIGLRRVGTRMFMEKTWIHLSRRTGNAL
jgi:hypothetical protein